MKVRVIEENRLDYEGNPVTYYIPQYFDQMRGWRECRLDNSLVAHNYRKKEDAINVCKAFIEKIKKENEVTVVWSANVEEIKI